MAKPLTFDDYIDLNNISQIEAWETCSVFQTHQLVLASFK